MKRMHRMGVVMIILIILTSSIFLLKEKSARNSSVTKAKAQNTVNVQKESKKTLKILFVGDMMFDRYIREVSAKKGNDFIFEKVKNLLFNDDLVVANLEGPITNNQSVSIGTQIGEKNHLIFTFDPSMAQALYDNNIELVNIGNNHILNYGKDGLTQTERNLDGTSVKYFGDTGENKTSIENINGYKIGFVNYNQFVSGSLERALENTGNLRKQADLVIVYTHWGTEYSAEISENIKNIGHQFIDSGADLIIGSHPHVIEGKEEYKSKEIYYSLGNFIFDQYFSPETKKGLAVEVSVYPDKKMEYKDIPLILDNNGQTRANSL